MSILAAASLAGSYDAGSAIVAGLIGGIAFLVVVYMGLGVGMTRMNLLHMLGSMVTPRSSRSTASRSAPAVVRSRSRSAWR